MEEIFLIILLLLALLTIFCLYRMLDKRGLYFSLVILNIISFVLSFKITYVFKMNINTNIITIIPTLTIIYFFISKYGYKEIKNLIKITLYSNIIIAIFLIIMNYFVPAVTETISINMQGTFEYNYKILIAYPIIMFFTQKSITKLYKLVFDIQNNIILCMVLTHIITSLLYTVIFCLISYIKVVEIKYSLFIGISTYIIGLAILIINIIFMNYLLKNKKVKLWVAK